MPLALAEADAPSAPLDKGKRVVIVPFDDDEDSTEGKVFKRQRTTQPAPQPAVSATSSSHGAESMRDDPPSASSPPQSRALEGGAEAKAASVPPPAPEFPSPIRDSLRGYLERVSPRGQPEAPKQEGIYYYMGAFMACAQQWREQARAKAIEVSTLQALEKKVASLIERKEKLARHWERQEDAYKTSLRVAQEAKEEASKRLHEVAQANAELLDQVVPLRAKVADLEDAAKASEAHQKKLEAQCVDREQKLGKTKGELAAKTEAFLLLQAENGKLQADVSKLQVEKEFLDKQLATNDSRIEELGTSNKELLEDMANTFEEGFKEALAQATCENPEINTSNCDPGHQIVEGKVVPLDLGE